MTLDEIRKQVIQEAEQKYDDPCERLQSNSERSLKYGEFLYRMKRQRNKQEILFNNKYSELYQKNKFKSNLLLKSKQDVDSFIDMDAEYQKIKKELDDLNAAVDYLEGVVKTYQQREYTEQLIFKFKTGIGG
jgi:hypothetical protein